MKKCGDEKHCNICGFYYLMPKKKFFHYNFKLVKHIQYIYAWFIIF